VKLYELNAKEIETGYYDPNEDKIGQHHPGKSRSNRLFLRDLNRLKKMRALKKLERLKREDLLGVMYSDEGSEAGGFGGPPGF